VRIILSLLLFALSRWACAEDLHVDFDRGADASGFLKTARLAAASASAPETARSRACAGRASVPGPALGTPAHARGLLWKIESPSGAVSWIFGTEHSEDAQVLDLLRRLRPFFESSRRLVTEVDMGDGNAADYMRGLALPPGTTLDRLLPRDLYRESIRMLDGYGVSEDAARTMKIWAVFNVLGRPPQRGGIILDKSLHEEGLRRRMPVTSIESVPELLASLDSVPTADQIESLRDAVCDFDENGANAERLGALYLKQDIGGMYAMSFAKVPADRRHMDSFLEAMLFKRSVRMASRLTPELETGGAFVAVGAMHLPGPRGLLTLLEARGFKTSAVDMDDPASRPAAAPEAPPRRAQAGPLAPALEGDIPELLSAEQAAAVWETVKDLSGLPADAAPPLVRLETFDPQRMSLDWTSWVARWGQGHPETSLPLPRATRGYYFAGTGTAQVSPLAFRKYYAADPASGMPRDFGGVGYYVLGREMLRYAYELKGVPAARRLCLMTSGPEGRSPVELLLRRLSDAGLSNAVLVERDGLMSERAGAACPAP
jgi:hypothetical protein